MVRGPNLSGNKRYRIQLAPAPRQVSRLFGEAAKDFDDHREALSRCATTMLNGIERIIRSEGSSLGEPWPGLRNKYYLARKARMGWPMSELFASGEMVASIRTTKVTKKIAQVGTDAKQARALQRGIGRRKGSGFWAGPKRPFIAVDDIAQAECRKELEASVASKLSSLASKINSSKDGT